MDTKIDKERIFSVFELLQTVTRAYLRVGQEDECSVGPLALTGVGTRGELGALRSSAPGSTLGDSLLALFGSDSRGEARSQPGQ